LRITVDEKPSGQAPAELILAPGPHSIVAKRAGYEELRRQLVLEVGERRSLVLNPVVESVALYKNPWFWAGVGVVASGVATSVYLLSREEPETSGSFSPPVLSPGGTAVSF
jgi:hypothetical protein